MSYRDENDVRSMWGKIAESVVTAIYVERGFGMVTLYKIQNGGAPMLIGSERNLVLPDLQRSKNGLTGYVEVKFKFYPPLYQITRQHRHGIDLPKWRHYCAIEQATGIDVTMAIAQYKPGREADPDPWLLEATIKHLAKASSGFQIAETPTPTAPWGMVYWNQQAMDRICPLPLDVADLPALRHRAAHPWERRDKSGHAPQAEMIRREPSLFGEK